MTTTYLANAHTPATDLCTDDIIRRDGADVTLYRTASAQNLYRVVQTSREDGRVWVTCTSLGAGFDNVDTLVFTPLAYVTRYAEIYG